MEKSLFEKLENEAKKLKGTPTDVLLKNRAMELHRIAGKLEQITLETGGKEKNKVEKEFCDYLNSARRALYDATNVNDPAFAKPYIEKALNLISVAERLK